MQKNSNLIHLQKTKVKISLIFAFFSVLVLSFLNFWSLTFKYQKNIKEDRLLLEDWIKASIRNFEMWDNENFQKQAWFWLWNPWRMKVLDSIDFLILDEEIWIISKEKIDYSFDSREFLQKMQNLPKEFSWKIFELNENFFVSSKKFFPKEKISSFVFKEMKYSKNDLFLEFFYSLIFIFWFWIFLYFLIFFLVSRNLKTVEKNFEEMENFVHNAWHELKTPLAVISSNLQLAEKIWKIWEFKELNKENLLEVNKANSLIEWLFSLSQISKEENIKDINLKLEIQKICNENSKKIEEKNISLNLDLNDFNFNIQKEHFYILFSNIFFNAIRYSEKNWEIKIRLKNWILEIKDKWIWISEKNKKKIFDRFFQEQESRESENWFWIWLSLVKKISEVYNFKIFVESEKWNWAVFKIKF